MKLFGKQLGAFDVLKVCGYISGFSGLVTPDVVETFGVHSPTTATHVSHFIGGVVVASTLIANAIRSAIANGSTIAIIPKGTIPAVVTAPGANALTVARLDESSDVPPTAITRQMNVTSASR